jgi:hypothetical protein
MPSGRNRSIPPVSDICGSSRRADESTAHRRRVRESCLLAVDCLWASLGGALWWPCGGFGWRLLHSSFYLRSSACRRLIVSLADIARPGGGWRGLRESESYLRRVSGACPVSLPRVSQTSSVGLAYATEAPGAGRARGIPRWAAFWPQVRDKMARFRVLTVPGCANHRRAHPVELHAASNPIAVGPLHPDRIMLEAQDLPHLVQRLELRVGHHRLESHPPPPASQTSFHQH